MVVPVLGLVGVAAYCGFFKVVVYDFGVCGAGGLWSGLMPGFGFGWWVFWFS